jgi:hypothetical protein
MDNDICRKISGWFKAAKYADMQLPRGWFGGRIGEALLVLTWVEARPHMLLVELDKQILLVFTDVQSVIADKNQLILRDFAQLVVDGKYFDGMEPFAEVYQEGEVIFRAMDAF